MRNKKLISYKIALGLNIPSEISKKFTDTFISFIKNNAMYSDIKLSGFGTFYKHRTLKRIGRNPKTKESYIIEPRDKINFRASNKLKEVLN